MRNRSRLLLPRMAKVIYTVAVLFFCLQQIYGNIEAMTCFVTSNSHSPLSGTQQRSALNNYQCSFDSSLNAKQEKSFGKKKWKPSFRSFIQSKKNAILMDETRLEEQDILNTTIATASTNNNNSRNDSFNEIHNESLGAYLLQKTAEVEQQILQEQAHQHLQNNTQFINETEVKPSAPDGKLPQDASIPSVEFSMGDDFGQDPDSIIDELQIKQLESSITPLPNIEATLKDIKILTSKSSIIIPSRAAAVSESSSTNGTLTNGTKSRSKTTKSSSPQNSNIPTQIPLRKRLFRRGNDENSKKNKSSSTKSVTDKLPLGDPDVYSERISRDIQHLAVRIASTIETPEQFSLCCEENGGIRPLFECIHESALSISAEPLSYDLAGFNMNNAIPTKGMMEKEENFSAACTACKSLRNLCALSPDIASVVTDTAIRLDKEREKNNERTLLGDLIILLKYNSEFDKTSQRLSAFVPTDGGGGLSTLRNRMASARERRHRCRLHVLQLLLAMAVANDEAVSRLRSTPGLIDAVMACSSYANLEEEKSSRLRFPLNVFFNFLFPTISAANKLNGPKTVKMSKPKRVKSNSRKKITNDDRQNKDISESMTHELEGPANKLLAAIGYNVWVPKAEGQKGLRILCLDGGGTRGMATIASLRAIVDTLDGVEPYDAFDIIAGTSTGGIIAFLVGLRRESAELAKKRYDTLIKRIFVKSALSTPMLVFTTASYDEIHFTEVMKEIMGESIMLDSRADPKVPLVFAVSSKMSSTPTQLCLFRNYNYNGGEMPDKFVVDPYVARENLNIPLEQYDNAKNSNETDSINEELNLASWKTSRHPGSFRVLQRIALRASTAAPTFFKPLLMGGELYCDGAVGASNPTAIAIHEARSLFPDTPIELVVSLGTGAFEEEISAPKIGWDGILGQIVNSALDGEQTHHTLEDILGQGGTAKLGQSSVSQTRYYRFNPLIGKPDSFPIDETSSEKLDELSRITASYMKEKEQSRKLQEVRDILSPKRKRTKWWKSIFVTAQT